MTDIFVRDAELARKGVPGEKMPLDQENFEKEHRGGHFPEHLPLHSFECPNALWYDNDMALVGIYDIYWLTSLF